jgi:hypothetical protein
MTTNTWPRNRCTGIGGGLYTGVGGGAYTGVGGGLYTGPGGGLYTGPGGGLYTGPDSNVYRSNQPPMRVLIPFLRRHGKNRQADVLAKAHRLDF